MLLLRSIVDNNFSLELMYANTLNPEKYSISTDATSANPEIVRILIKSLCE